LNTNKNLALSVSKNPSKLFSLLAKNWALFFLLILILIFSFTGKRFFQLANFQNIIHLSTISLLLAAAETFVIITGGIDLSVGFMMGLSSVLSATIMHKMHAVNFLPALSISIGSIFALIVCIIAGLISGIMITKYRVPSFIATLGMGGIASGIALIMCEGFPVTFLPPYLTDIGNGYLIYILPGKAISFFNKPEEIAGEELKELIRIIPNSFIFIVIVLFILWHILKNTKFGQHTYAIGGSMVAAVRAGINTNRHLIIIYVLSSFLAGLAGVFNVFQTGVGNYTQLSSMYELLAVASVVIGGASLFGGKGKIIGSVIGVILISVIENGLQLSGVDPFYRFIAVGLILIAAIIIDRSFPDLF
jgi:ribose transport system permease protein